MPRITYTFPAIICLLLGNLPAEAREEVFHIAAGPVDPETTIETRALYDFLKFQFRHRIISGQTHSYYEEIENLTGKSPLLRAGDLSSYTEGYPYLWSGGGHTLGKNPDGTVEQLLDWYNLTGNKGIVSFQWHWHSPTGGLAGQNNFYTKNTSFDITKAVTPGTQEYDDIIRDIDDISEELKKFQDAGIPVLWRPLHEAGGGWFWWGAKGPEPCKQLYNIMFDRMINHHGLHNLIWVWSTPEETWYPGNNKVDIIGHDSYPGSFNYGNQKSAFDMLYELTGGEKLIAMTENGPIPNPDQCLDQGASWLYFMSWNNLVSTQNTPEHINEVYHNQDVLTVESQNFKSGWKWRSSLYPERWKPGFKDSRGRFLHDFSYAGYHGDNRPIPHITENVLNITEAPYSADNTGTKDVTSIIQQALNDAGSSGGGVVYLPAGTYRIKIPSGADHGLAISYNHTVLRGAGADSTFLFHDETMIRQKKIIYVGPVYASWFSPTGNSTRIRFDLNMPTRVIPVESIDGYQVGDQVIVRNTPTKEFIDEHGMTGSWTESSIKGVAFKREIDSIDATRHLLIMDTPTRYPLKTRDFARVYHAKPHLEESGIEHLSIGNKENSKTGWAEEDYLKSGTGAYDAHFSHAIIFEFSQNCWVKDVHTYKPASNIQDVHLASNCLLLTMCRHITVDSCNFQKPQYEGGGGNGYMYTLQSNDCLIRNSRANHSRHNFDFKYPFSNGNVIYNCRGENSKYSSDFHMYLSMSNLFDQCTVNGDYLESTFRPYGGSSLHGYSSSQSVFYNTIGENYHTNRDYIVDSRQYKWGYVIGTSGQASHVKTDPVAGSINGYAYDTSPRDFVEGAGEGTTLVPSSLYLDQLTKRKSDLAAMHSYDLSVVVKNAATREPIPDSEVRIYKESQLTNGLGSSFFQGIPEMFSMEVLHGRYTTSTLQQVVIYSDTLLTVYLDEQTFHVSFLLVDEFTLDPVPGARITMNENVQVTDDSGKAYFTTHGGSSTYSFLKNSYAAVSGKLEIISDTLYRFRLHRTHAYVKIWLKSGMTPVNNAIVKIGSDSLVSTSLGLATFRQLPVHQTYHYSAAKEGFEPIEGEFYLIADTSIHLALSKILSAVNHGSSGEVIRTWPNPVSDILHCSFPPGLGITSMKITDMRGKVVHDQKVDGDQARVFVVHYPPGIYLLSTSGNQQNTFLRPLPFSKQ